VAGDRWSGWFVLGHRLAGLGLLVLAPAKLRGSVKAGFRRGRPSRWLSAAFGVLVLATIALGILHATGLWYGVGYWTALWTHELFAFALIPLFLWHLASRPVRPLAGWRVETAGPRDRTRWRRTTRPACRARCGSTTTPRRASTLRTGRWWSRAAA
jgi:hypothetical protein